METIKFNPSVVLSAKSKYQKLVKICNLFTSNIEFEAGKKMVDLKADTDFIRLLGFGENGVLHISGEDERLAASLIRECISC